jgi:hypothetical protein
VSNVAFTESFDLLENRQFSWSVYGGSHLMGKSETEKIILSLPTSLKDSLHVKFSLSFRKIMNKEVSRFIQQL